MKKKILSIILSIFIVFLLVSCNSKSIKTTTNKNTQTSENTISTNTTTTTATTIPTTTTAPVVTTTIDPATSTTEPVITTTTTAQTSTTTLDDDEEAEISSIQDVTILHAWNWKLNDIKARLKEIKKAGYYAIQTSPLQVKVDKNGWSNQSTSSQWWKLYQPLAYKIAEDGESFLGNKADLKALCTEAKKYDIKIIVDVVLNHLAGDKNGYNNQVYTKYPLHNNGGTNDNSIEAVVRGHIGLPDIDTSNETVQNDALKLLKDYLDCGVAGFRFDAAKHIETPDDGVYASEFWPTILNGAKEYAKTKNYDEPYYYGEVLNTPGVGRSFSSYTKYMSITDSNQGTMVTNAVKNKKINDLDITYNTKEDADKLVLWAESHDTYANDSGYVSTRSVSTEDINKSYIIQASRKDAASLYFARPTNMNVTICQIDDNSGWKNKEIWAINYFHRHFIGKAEVITKANNCFINVRGTGSYAGAVIVNLGASSSQKLTLDGLENRTYVDLISGKKYELTNKEATIEFTNGAAILVTEEVYNNIEEDSPTDDRYKSSIVLKDYNQNLAYVAWVWQGSNGGSWYNFTADNGALGLNISSGYNYIIVEFPSGTNKDNANWDKKIRQTNDLYYNGEQTIIEYESINWK